MKKGKIMNFTNAENYNSLRSDFELLNPVCQFSDQGIVYKEISHEQFIQVENYKSNVFAELTDSELISISERLNLFSEIYFNSQLVSIEELINERLQNARLESQGFLLNRVFVTIIGEKIVLCIKSYLPSFAKLFPDNNENSEHLIVNTVGVDGLIDFLNDRDNFIGSRLDELLFTLNDNIDLSLNYLREINFRNVYTELVKRSNRIDTVLESDPIGLLYFSINKFIDDNEVRILLHIDNE